jgi:hypothetical protein
LPASSLNKNLAKKDAIPLAVARIKAREAAKNSDSDAARARRDVLFWINTYCWTFDPRREEGDRHVKFELYPFQEDYIKWLEARYSEQRDAGIEKSRDMGASWCTVAWLVWHWLYHPGFSALLGSRVEAYVDNKLPDSLFGKIDYILQRLPAWMLPEGFSWDEHRTYMKLINPENGNTITGESANPKFSRGGRYSVVVLDEFGFWDWAESVWTSTADSTRCRIPLSTPNGANTFKRIRFSGKIAFYTLHWRMHPHKDEAWYQAECGRRDEADIAQELDISYEKSVRGKVYDEWEQVRRGDFPFMAGWPLYVSWDFGLNDANALIWWQRNPTSGLYRAVDAYQNAGKTIDFYVPLITGEMLSGLPYTYDDEALRRIEAHRGWGVAVHYGDPAGKQRNQVTGTSVITELARRGVYINSKPSNAFKDRRDATKMFLRMVEGVNMPDCLALDDAITNAKYPERSELSQATTPIVLPIHDWTAHFRSSLEYAALNMGTGTPSAPRQQRGVGHVPRERAAWEDM